MEMDLSQYKGTRTLTLVETEDDPDGADRGGYHQYTQTLEVSGPKLTYSQEVSDEYEDRFGETPEPQADTKEEALKWLDKLIARRRRELVELEQFRAEAAATTEFTANILEPSEDDEDEENDED